MLRPSGAPLLRLFEIGPMFRSVRSSATPDYARLAYVGRHGGGESVVGVESLGPDLSWRPLYLAGAVAVLLYVVLVVVPVTLVFVAPVPPIEGRAVLEYIATHK